MSLADDPGTDAGSLRVEVIRGNPTDDELAALLAVVTVAYTEEAEDAIADDEPSRTAWSRSQRALQTAPPRERGWNNFPG